MEFPATGNRCSWKECKQLDFLPIPCDHCKLEFCKEHFHIMSHSCSQFVDNVATNLEKLTSYCCSDISCIQTSVIQMPCVVCKKHFCLAHRYHGCLELSEEEKLQEKKKWDKPKEDFANAKAAVDQTIKEKLKKSKNSAMAIKVQLMKLKGSSIGSQGIPTADRRYFLVHYPSSTKNAGTSKGAFVSISWSMGKTIDSIADLLGIPNSNNVSTSKKLRMFHHETGLVVSERMDTLLLDLFNSKELIDGQSIIFEYCNDHKLDPSIYRSKTF